MDAERFLSELTAGHGYRGQLARAEKLPPRPARYADLSPALPEPLVAALEADGIEQLYTHQAAAIAAVRGGQHVVVVTGTASGKTLCYNGPVLETLLAQPTARALYLFPTKALAQDQLKTLQAYDERIRGLTLTAGTYDGDTPQSRRRTLREKAQALLTNPDMLHSGILPNHARWSHFFGSLKYVVVDELHTYRGIFGSNVGLLLRRLRRVCRHYGSDPIFICCSATIGNPGDHATNLTGLPVTVIDDDGAPSGGKYFALWNPPIVDRTLGLRRSSNQEAQYLMTRLISDWQAQTIAFLRARRTAELLYRYVREALEKRAPRLASKIRSYRGGYLPQERRDIEHQLFSGELLGVTSTNALELGIDIGTLEACLIVGYPGSIASTWQQAGRAGRKTDEALAMLIASSQPIDQYLMAHPEYFFGQSHESAVADPGNPYVLAGHLRCALQELPLDAEDLAYFGPLTPGVVRVLADEKEAIDINGRWFWSGPEYPAGDINLRNADPNSYVIQDDSGPAPRVIGTIDEWSAFTTLHDEAVYLHNGETYTVEHLDTDQRVAHVKPQEMDYFTVGVDKTEIHTLRDEEEDSFREREGDHWRAGLGPARVTSLVYMFRKIKFYQADSIGFGNLKLPPHELLTETVYVAPVARLLQAVRDAGMKPEDGMLGASNALAGVLPARVMCDPADIGAVVDAANLGKLAVFIYDRFPGGVGYAQRVYEDMEAVLAAALDLVANCPCERGCPSCVGAPEPVQLYEDIDSRGAMPDKEATLALLRGMVTGEYPEPKAVPATATTAPAAVGARLDAAEQGTAAGRGGAARRPAGEAEETAGAAAEAAAEPTLHPMPEERLPIHVEQEIRKRLANWRVNRKARRRG